MTITADAARPDASAPPVTPAQPLTSSFADFELPHPLVARLAERGITEAFDIQARTLPDALQGKDLLGRGATGSGKTLGFGLPLLTRTSRIRGKVSPRHPRALILVPTRELAQQVDTQLAQLGSALSLRVRSVYGGASMGRQIDNLERGVHVLVATPGRLIDLIQRGHCSLDQVQTTVLDEADHMADLGFMPAVTELLDQIPGGQRMLFSATLDRDVDKLVKRYLHEPVVHEVASPEASVTTMDHRFYVVRHEEKIGTAARLVRECGRTIVFVRTKHGADRLARQLSQLGVRADAIHGNLSQNKRSRALAGFDSGRCEALVATDVAARGIHVDAIAQVLQFDPPDASKAYVHRSGRTARAGASGQVTTLLLRNQRSEVSKMLRQTGVEGRFENGPGIDPELGTVSPSASEEPAPRRNERRGGAPAGGGPRGERGQQPRKPRHNRGGDRSQNRETNRGGQNRASQNRGNANRGSQNRSGGNQGARHGSARPGGRTSQSGQGRNHR